MFKLSRREIVMLLCFTVYILVSNNNDDKKWEESVKLRNKSNSNSVQQQDIDEDELSLGSEIDRNLLQGNLNTIPEKLWFTYETDILKEQEPKKLYNNVIKTYRAYKTAFGNDHDIAVEVVDEERCANMIRRVPIPGASTDLLKYFEQDQKGIKADICRIVTLYFYGGYYFSLDIEVVDPYIVPKDVTFAAVQSSENFFQAFIASTPYHPILYNNLLKLVAVAHNKLQVSTQKFSSVGPIILQMSYFEVLKVRYDLKHKSKLLIETKSEHLNQNEYGAIEKQDGFGELCDYVIVDAIMKKFHFYSRFVNSNDLCKNEKYLFTLR